MKSNKSSVLASVPTPNAAVSAASTQAFMFTETDDAGDRLNNAVSVLSNRAQPLTSISGTLSSDVDLFQIFITGDQQFSATTLNRDTLLELPIDNTIGIPSNRLGDPQLFLFDAQGNGVYANDDLFGSSQATLPSMGLSPVEPGIYYLAISSFDVDPISADGEIFLDESFDGVLPPTGVGGNAPLLDFEGESTTSGSYVITLTGSQTVVAPVINGTNGNDRLLGTIAPDIINGLGGRDTIRGNVGNDTIFGGGGNDRIRGEDGNDAINGQGGNDNIRGNDGNDILNGNGGRDRITGNIGDDILNGNRGSDRLQGGDGDDLLRGGRGSDILKGDSNRQANRRGRDTFVLAVGEGTDRIRDFRLGEDVIGLADGLNVNRLSFEGERITVGNETLAILNGINTEMLTADSFVAIA